MYTHSCGPIAGFVSDVGTVVYAIEPDRTAGPGNEELRWEIAMNQPQSNSPSTPRKVALALQGGGSHGAFTWGALDRMLEDEKRHTAGRRSKLA